MGNRLSKIVTRTGDAGTTGLGDGTRVAKDSLRVETMGQVDELNSTIGLLLTEEMPDDIRQALAGVQHDLFDLGGELCIPGMDMINDAQIKRLEDLVEQFNADLPPLKDFILPGGTRAAAVAHLARTVCRRAERCIVHLASRRKGVRLCPQVPESPVRPAVRPRSLAEPGRRLRRCAVGARQESWRRLIAPARNHSLSLMECHHGGHHYGHYHCQPCATLLRRAMRRAIDSHPRQPHPQQPDLLGQAADHRFAGADGGVLGGVDRLSGSRE
jgi:cob(I)alamin adenosyltransferase